MRPALAAFDETIAALATGAGRNALAVVRVSGRAAGEILSRIAPALPSPPPPRQARLADVIDAAGETIDRAVLTFFPGPPRPPARTSSRFPCTAGRPSSAAPSRP